MPSRANPYYTSADTYGSRNLAPSGRLGGDSLALPLAQLAGTIADVATYDPKTDPRLIGARADMLKINDAKDRNTVMGQIGPSLADTSVPLGDLAANAVGYGHMKPEDAGKIALLANAARGVQPGQNMDEALSGAGLWELASGTPGSSTFNAGTYGERMKPTAVRDGSGQASLVAAQDSYGHTPVLSKEQVVGSMLGDLAASLSRPEQLAAVGAEPKNPDVYSYRGPNGESGSTTNPAAFAKPGWQVYKATVQSADPTGLTKAVETGLQNRSIEEQRFGQMLDYAEGIGAKAADSDFGLVGNTKRFVQDSLQQGRGLQQFLGANAKDIDSAFSDAMATAQSHGVDPANFAFDPNLDKLGKIGTVLIFNAASIYANQNGRSVSDKDVALMKKFVGDPTQLMSSKAQYLNGLSTMRDLLGMSKQTTDARLDPAAPAATPAAAPAAGAPPEAKLAPDGNYYVPDPARPGKFLQWTPN